MGHHLKFPTPLKSKTIGENSDGYLVLIGLPGTTRTYDLMVRRGGLPTH